MFTIRLSALASTPLVVPRATFPVYICKLYTYPLSDSHSTHPSIPNFLGFAGRYWRKLRRPLNKFIMDSSITSQITSSKKQLRNSRGLGSSDTAKSLPTCKRRTDGRLHRRLPTCKRRTDGRLHRRLPTCKRRTDGRLHRRLPTRRGCRQQPRDRGSNSLNLLAVLACLPWYTLRILTGHHRG